MDESLTEHILKQFEVSIPDIRSFSPLTLAYIGDGIFDLVIRTLVVCEGNAPVQTLHGHTSHIVKAQTQAVLAESIEEELDEEEWIIMRRGRNAKSHTTAKNASVHDYRMATGYEALLGYLYLKGNTDRLLYLIQLGLKKTGRDKV